jgi:hypothetical protein
MTYSFLFSFLCRAGWSTFVTVSMMMHILHLSRFGLLSMDFDPEREGGSAFGSIATSVLDSDSIAAVCI